MTDTEQRVIRAIGQVAKDKDIKIDSTFEELGVDSLAAIEILFEVEEEFDIDIPGEGARTIRSVRDVVNGVEKLLAGDASALSGEASGDAIDEAAAS